MNRILVGVLALIGLAAAVPMGKVGSDPCTWGPSYWCGNVTKAIQCNAVDYCVSKVWQDSTKGLIGGDKCTWGPSYWCSGADAAEACQATAYCDKVGYAQASTKAGTGNIGSDPCTWGPAYWCSGIDAAEKCNALDYCKPVWENQQNQKN